MDRRSRQSPRNQIVQLVIGLILLCILGVAYVVAPELFSDELPATRTPAPIKEDAGGEWFRLYFTQPSLTANLNAPTGGIPDKVADTIGQVQRTLDIAMYEFDLEP